MKSLRDVVSLSLAHPALERVAPKDSQGIRFFDGVFGGLNGGERGEFDAFAMLRRSISGGNQFHANFIYGK